MMRRIWQRGDVVHLRSTPDVPMVIEVAPPDSITVRVLWLDAHAHLQRAEIHGDLLLPHPGPDTPRARRETPQDALDS